MGFGIGIRPWMVTAAAPLLCYGALDFGARIVLREQGWFDSWQYSTIADPALGYRLRPNLSNRLDGVETHTNADGLRSSQGDGHALAKAPGEVLIAALGDSNTFGAGIPFEQTYPEVLERELKSRLRQPVRVINLGGLGYSIVQSAALARQWAHLRPDVLVLAVNSFNDRVFVGRTDSSDAFARDAASRVYEIGDWISFPILHWHRSDQLAQAVGTPPPEFRSAIPVPRVPRARFALELRQLIEFAQKQGAGLVLLSTPESADVPGVAAGLEAYNRGHWEEALAAFGRAAESNDSLFLPAYYAYSSASRLGRDAVARSIRDRYVRRYAETSDHYQHNFSHFSHEYAPVVASLADRFDLVTVDVTGEFASRNVGFSKGHYDAAGHAAVARALAQALAPTLARREPDGTRALSKHQ